MKHSQKRILRMVFTTTMCLKVECILDGFAMSMVSIEGESEEMFMFKEYNDQSGRVKSGGRRRKKRKNGFRPRLRSVKTWKKKLLSLN